jgi:hypothetical protein
MVRLAVGHVGPGNVSFRVGSHRLESVPETFDVVLDRQAPLDLGRDRQDSLEDEERRLAEVAHPVLKVPLGRDQRVAGQGRIPIERVLSVPG